MGWVHRAMGKRALWVVGVVVLIPLLFAAARAGAPRVADTLHVTVRSIKAGWAQGEPQPTMQTIFDRTFSDQDTITAAADALDAARRDMPLGLAANGGCNLGGDTYYFYTLAFTWHGRLMEGASVDSMSPSCAEWKVTALGVSDLRPREGFTPATWAALIRATKLPAPSWAAGRPLWPLGA